MTMITKVTGPDKYPCSLEHMPQATKTRMTITEIQSSSVLGPAQCYITMSHDKDKGVTEPSSAVTILCHMNSLWDNILLKLCSTYFLNTRILILPQSRIGRKGQLRQMKKAHKLWSRFVFLPLENPPN